MKKTIKQQLGKNGEKLACQFLQAKGLSVVTTNYRAGHGEVDIIAKDDKEKMLIFVEVKSYFAAPLDPPEFRVSKKQQKMIMRSAYSFLDTHREFDDFTVRYDILLVNFSKYPAQITHYEAAFWQDDAFLP